MYKRGRGNMTSSNMTSTNRNRNSKRSRHSLNAAENITSINNNHTNSGPGAIAETIAQKYNIDPYMVAKYFNNTKEKPENFNLAKFEAYQQAELYKLIRENTGQAAQHDNGFNSNNEPSNYNGGGKSKKRQSSKKMKKVKKKKQTKKNKTKKNRKTLGKKSKK